MLRPGRFALSVLAVTVVSFGVLAPASYGQAVSLSGESLESNAGVAGQETTFGAFTCNKGGTTTIPFQSRGPAFGPYFGTFTETGTITLGPQTNMTLDSRGVGGITNFQATFTIDSQFPSGIVTGSKRLSATAPTVPSLAGGFGRCDPDGSSPPNDAFAIIPNPNVLYDAQIVATTGSRSDSGAAGVLVRSLPQLPSTSTFEEAFTSSEPVPPPPGGCPSHDDDPGDDDDGDGDRDDDDDGDCDGGEEDGDGDGDD